MPDVILLELSAYQACMLKILLWNRYNYHNQYDYIISSTCFIIMNMRNSIKSSRLKMIYDRVHYVVMSLSLNKFPLYSSTHQNLFKLLLKLSTMQAPNKDQFKEAYSQKALIFIEYFSMIHIECTLSNDIHNCIACSCIFVHCHS